jgi:drug/metabolite transporter (DMT)-like permease
MLSCEDLAFLILHEEIRTTTVIGIALLAVGSTLSLADAATPEEGSEAPKSSS